MSEPRAAGADSESARYCLCSDPEWCLRFADPDYRKRAIFYRLAHGAPIPLGPETS